MNYNFTDRVRKVLAMAREEAIRLQHDYVGTEHLLLGLIREGEGVAAAVLTNLNVDLEQAAGRTLTEAERDAHRAVYVRRILAEEGDVRAESSPEGDEV